MPAPPIVELCPECAERWRAHQRELYQARRIKRSGTANRRVPPYRAARYVDELRAREGMTLADIAAAAGCSRVTLKRLLHAAKHRTGERCWSSIADAILAIDPNAEADVGERPLELDDTTRVDLRARGYRAF